MATQKTKVMIVNTVGLAYDGITNVIFSYLQAMDLSELEIHIAGTIKVDPDIAKRLKALGCRLVYFPSRKDETFKYFRALLSYLKKHHIQVIHAHGNSATLTIELLAGRLAGCKKRIAHSHNTQCSQVRADKILRPVFYRLYTEALACGQAAGEWLFPRRKFTILKNGRDMNKFAYDESKRRETRDTYGIKDELVIGHVGGFVEQKNHKFLLEIYRAIHSIEPSAKLFMLGDGVLRQQIEEEASDLKDVLTFVGNVAHIEDYLQMMDGMVFPSLFEGLPLVVLEWQINGLPALLSDVIDSSCAVTDQVEFMSLEESAQRWAEKIIAMAKASDRAENVAKCQQDVRSAGFDIKDSAGELEKLYKGVPLKLCCVASSGGHWEELQCLKPIFASYEHFYVTEEGGQADDANTQKIYTVSQINRKELRFFLKFLRLCGRAWKISRREKPNVYLTTGALIAVPFCYIGKLFGKKVIYIESFARVDGKSLTGKLIYPIADLFVVQWEEMLKLYPKARYGGRIF